MLISKTKIIELINSLPQEKFEDIDEVIEEINLMKKIERAERGIEEGRVYTHQEIKNHIDQWLKNKKHPL